MGAEIKVHKNQAFRGCCNQVLFLWPCLSTYLSCYRNGLSQMYVVNLTNYPKNTCQNILPQKSRNREFQPPKNPSCLLVISLKSGVHPWAPHLIASTYNKIFLWCSVLPYFMVLSDHVKPHSSGGHKYLHRSLSGDKDWLGNIWLHRGLVLEQKLFPAI